MVHHIILWTLKPELKGSQKEQVLRDIKSGLEGLKSVLPCIVDIRVNISQRLDSSNCDLMLDSTFLTQQDLQTYAQSAEHLAVANGKVRPYTIQRVCFDYQD